MPEGEEAQVQAVSLKLPQFWPQQPEIWFAQAEAQFAIRNITVDETKYYYVVAALDQDTAARVLDLLKNPPAAGKFAALRNRLLETFTLSEFERAGRILHMPELGDDKPSALMDKMLGHLGSHTPCFLFQRVFLERMPEEIRPALVHANLADPRELARMADQLWQAHRQETCVVRNRKTAQKKDRPTTEICYYHHRFGQEARQCRAPCKFSMAMPSGNDPADRQ